MTYAIKVEVKDSQATTFVFPAQKTMYGGKHIAAGDTIFVFASETQGGQGLLARGVVTHAEPVPLRHDGARENPRVSIAVDHLLHARKPLGRDDLKRFTAWHDGQPATELNFKFYRQATNKIVGISAATSAFLDEFFAKDPSPVTTPYRRARP